MKLPRRKFLHLAIGAAALPAATRIALAQAYPTRPVHWIVGFPAGGTTDILARLMAQWLSERLGQQFIIENRPGAGTNIALQAAVNSRPDGYTLVSVTSSNASNATLYESLPFNTTRHRSGCRPIQGCAGLGGEPVDLDQIGGGVYRACKGQPGQNQHCIIWRRFDQPSGARTVQSNDRYQRGACALSWRCHPR